MLKLWFRRNLTPIAALTTLAVAAAACSKDSTGPGLTAPAGLSITQVTLVKVNVSWSAVSGATSYVVERTSASTPGVFANVGGTIAATAVADSNLTAGLAYGYRVAAVSGSDTSAFSAIANIATGVQAAKINGNITADRTLYKDTVYTLSGYIKVQNGKTLTIQAGTRIVGDTTVVGSSLWILRGAKIMANGTAADPIILTSARAPGFRKPGDWGGLIIIGNGIINRTGTPILTEGGAAGQAEDYSGGNNNNDNSGVLRYVRIEFAGYDVSNGAGQELNSLSSYAVGRGTTYEYIQTMSGLDDSFEWWGGAVDGRYLVSYESGDDHFDWTEGYAGRNQFLIALQTQRLSPAPGTGVYSTDPRGFEGDGCDPALAPSCVVTTTATSTPYSMPVFANFTMIGTGQLAGIPADGNGAVLRRGTGGTFRNGILARWKGIGWNIRDAWSDSLFVGSNGRDSLDIQAVLLAQNGFNLDTGAIGSNNSFSQTTNWVGVAAPRLATLKQFASSVLIDTLLGISTNPAGLNWQPTKNLTQVNTGAVVAPAARVTGYFGGTWVNTTYLGAVDPAGALWYAGWTAYAIN